MLENNKSNIDMIKILPAKYKRIFLKILEQSPNRVKIPFFFKILEIYGIDFDLWNESFNIHNNNLTRRNILTAYEFFSIIPPNKWLLAGFVWGDFIEKNKAYDLKKLNQINSSWINTLNSMSKRFKKLKVNFE